MWRYAANKSKLELGISVPLPGGGSAGIGHKLAQHAEKTLGAMTSPDGNSRAAIMMIQYKAQKWVNDVHNGKLHQRNVWFSMKCQLVPKIIYGLFSSVAAKFEYKAFPKLAASTIESLYIQIYMVILWPNIEYGATK